MFDGEKPEQVWRPFISDMIASGEAVLAFTDGMNIEEFVNDERTYKAALWDISIIGEAARHIPIEIRSSNPNIPWGEIIGMRDRITHGYQAIDTDIVWDTIKTDIPKMLTDLRALLKRIDDNSP